jgi:hypothetical protein
LTVINPPSYLQASSHPSQTDRRALAALTVDRGGIVHSGDLAVSQNGTPNMSVNVATGRVVIPGSEATYQGSYLCDNQGTTNLTVDASDPTNARYDRVVAKVQDAEYSGATNAWSLAVVKGTAGAVPAEPSLPANCVELARITVGAGVTSITTGNLVDRRISSTKGRAVGLGGIVPTASGALPTANLSEGLVAVETDTNYAKLYNGSAWVGLDAYARPMPQWFTGSVSGGTVTSFTAFVTQNSILTAPYPLTMEVEVFGRWGFASGLHQVNMTINDEAGVNILHGTYGGFNEYYQDVEGYWEGFAIRGKKDYAAAATCGFRLMYKNAVAGNVSVETTTKVTFHPKVS